MVKLGMIWPNYSFHRSRAGAGKGERESGTVSTVICLALSKRNDRWVMWNFY